MLNRYILLLSAFIGLETVSAYIDPGTGGMIIGGTIWPMIIGLFAIISGFILKYFYNPLKGGVLGLWRKIIGEKPQK